MKILLCNDDGIHAAGLKMLAFALSEIADLTVVAPLTERSASGHSISMKTPLRISEVQLNENLRGFAIDGTPADCVKIALKTIMPIKPDLVISGINHGANTAVNIIYSGTVAAAREGAINGIPSIAFSITSHTPVFLETSVNFAIKIINLVHKKGLEKGIALNVNIPNLPENEIAGILPVRQGDSIWDDFYDERIDPFGRKYYWIAGKLQDCEKLFDTDQIAIKENFVTITPLNFNMTDEKFLAKLKKWNFK